MRLHRLRLTAFGSFAGTEEVNFDALGEAGLFLIHGQTGAGKTTVLDAVCYALYGRVPGRRDSARALRCDHAPPDRGPVVVLEATIRGRRLRVTRSPAWMRPKLRGDGLVEEKAKALVEELTDRWITRSTRSDEAGHLIGELLGMNADQFCQVAMLPQGDFAKFLRADGDDRRKLLERLFSVRVFTDLEGWLADLRTRTGRERQELAHRVDSVLDRMRGAAGDGLPLPEDDADPAAWSGAVTESARAVLDETVAGCEAAQTVLLAARARLRAGEELADRRGRHAAALARSRELDAAADERSDLEVMLDDAARADRVLPLLRQAGQRAEAAAKAGRLAADAVSRALPGEDAPGADRLATLERERRDEITRVRQALPEESRLREVREELDRTARTLASLTDEDRLLAERLATLPARRGDAENRLSRARVAAAAVPGLTAARDAALRLRETTRQAALLDAELERLAAAEAEALAAQAELPAALAAADGEARAAREAAARLPGLEAARGLAGERLEAARLRDALRAELEAAAQARRAAVDRAQDLRDRLQDVRLRRIEGMAAELAAGLVEGGPCAVCGSTDHPAPARAAVRAATADDEQAAQDEFDAAQRDREEAESAAAALSSALEAASARAAGRTAEEAAAALAETEAELADRRESAAREPVAAELAERLAADLDAARDRAAELASAITETRTRREAVLTERARVAATLDQGLFDTGVRGGAGDLESTDLDPANLGGMGRGGMALGGMGLGSADLGSPDPAGTDLEGADPEGTDLESAVEAAERRLERARALAAREDELAVEVAGLAAEHDETDGRARQVALDLAAARAHADGLAADKGRLSALIDAARGSDPTLAARIERLEDEATLVREAAEAVRAAAVADGEREAALGQAARAAREAGFAGVEDAEAAARPAADREEMARRLRELDAERASVEALLADPELTAAAAAPAPDLATLEREHAEAEREHGAGISARDRARDRLRQLTGLAAELEAALRAYRPADERHRLARRLAELTGGTSSDNRWHMRLSSFVLGERLRQVVEAANERLDRMSGGRYLLRHDLARSAGDRGRSGGGLGLRVLDAWTGVDRDPATLSGGESFIASLALALGLADVVTQEAGGAEIGTLFVDEGFGTLDDETLDDVLDILDGLREGGRAVGVVSHVAELRVRIPARLRVVKGRSGSSLSQR
ncbi:SMC family ATPase [Microbispora sp. RL4-1S]|uniref:Nuclease SbcCD subunit C n=1 Tax=Microbispora oryzae TaxID=2806554 RepID=A0A941AJ11_9ACTN|nr:SMC family ATPase [Microbispora oryzae]MBP2705746.1 SMC family ATPase [Microbispora oryzae]